MGVGTLTMHARARFKSKCWNKPKYTTSKLQTFLTANTFQKLCNRYAYMIIATPLYKNIWLVIVEYDIG